MIDVDMEALVKLPLLSLHPQDFLSIIPQSSEWLKL